MRKSLIKNICLSLACLLGIGGLTGVALSSPKETTQVSAAATYYTEKKTYLYLFNPETNKGATTLSEVDNTGTWKVSRPAEDAENYYNYWRGMPSSETVTFTRNQSIKHIYMVEVYIQQFYSKTDPKFYPVKGTLSIGGSVVSTAQSDGSQSSSSIFTNKLAYKGDEKDGVVKVSLNAVNSSTYSFFFDEIFIYYREYSAIPVTLNDNGGSGGEGTINCTYDEAMPASVNVPTRSGYRFDGYYNGTKQYYKADGKRAFTNFDVKAEAFTLTAKWTLMEFDITLNDNEGTGGQGSIKAIYGNAMPNLTTLPTRTGYSFQGYYNAKSGGTQYFDANGKGVGTYGLTKATTVYARWEANKYNVSFDPTQGAGGINALEATYDVPLRDLTSEEIPTREQEHGHSYSFGGYYTQAPTEDENGYQTPNGKCYINELGKGVLWKEANDTTLYAYWTIDMTVTSSSWSGTWSHEEGKPNVGVKHGITVTPVDPEDAVVWYGLEKGKCNSTNAEQFLRSDAGVYEIFFEVRKDGYTTYYGSETITINKAESIINPRPTAVSGLEYTALDQELVVTGEVDYGDMLYAVNTTGELPADGEFSAAIPTGKLVDTYYVFYKSSGDGNHNPYAVVETEVITINIARVDRTEITNLNDAVLAYLDTISQKYPEIAATLEAVRAEVYQDAIVEDNITVEGVNQNIIKLQEALSAAKVDVTEVLINAIGTVSYPDSKDAIEEAKDYFDNVLSQEEQAAVNATLVETLNKDNKDYNDAKAVADLINAIPEPSDTDEYYKAVEDAKEAYDALATSNPDAYTLVNGAADKDYEVILKNNVEAKEVIELIDAIGELTYNGGADDSLDDIEAAEAAYKALATSNPDALELVNQANHNDLVDARDSYDDVDETVKLIAAIGEIVHGGDDDSKEALEAAREAYDALSEEEKELVNGYENSYKVLDDGEHVYTALEYIDEIGEVSFDSESEEKINEAREFYDSLTEDQKEQIGKDPLVILENSETQYDGLKKSADILVIILLIVASLTILGGIWFLFLLLKKRKDDDDDENKEKGEPVKAMSVGGLLPLILLISHYLDAPYIALYVLSGVALLLWISILVVAIMKKKQVGPFKKKEVASKVEPQTSLSSNDEEEAETITDENGNTFQIRFIKSFTAKLIQSPEETKKYYEELKNEVLSYKNTKSRISWHFDSVNSGRDYILKFAIRGKTLGVYLPLNADDYADSKYKVEKAESRRYEDVPCLYRIKNDRRLGYAKELIAVVAANLGLVKGEEQHEVYSDLPYEPNKPLIERGLIKEQRIQINKPIEEVAPTNEEEDEVVVSTDSEGNVYKIRYIKSFTAKLIQSSDETKKYYEILKNEALSYNDVSNRVSWHYDSINSGRTQVLKFGIRGKTLCVYYPLNIEDVDQNKYKVEKIESKKYEQVPCMYRINSNRKLELAKVLIARVMRKLHLEKGEEQHEVYSNLPYEENKPLVERGLIKELKVSDNKPSEPEVVETKVNADGDEIIVEKDKEGNLVEIRFVKSFTAKLSQASDEVKEYYNVLKNYVLAYKGIHTRVSWYYDAANVGREHILKFAIRGKTLCVYFGLDKSKVDEKYKVEDAKGRRYAEVPVLYRIKNDRRVAYAKELIDQLMNELGVEKGKELNDEYRIPYESTKALLLKGLIKEVRTKVPAKQ